MTGKNKCAIAGFFKSIACIFVSKIYNKSESIRIVS